MNFILQNYFFWTIIKSKNLHTYSHYFHQLFVYLLSMYYNDIRNKNLQEKTHQPILFCFYNQYFAKLDYVFLFPVDIFVGTFYFLIHSNENIWIIIKLNLFPGRLFFAFTFFSYITFPFPSTSFDFCTILKDLECNYSINKKPTTNLRWVTVIIGGNLRRQRNIM